MLTYSGVNLTVSAAIGGDGLLEVVGGATRVAISNQDSSPIFTTPFDGAVEVGQGSELELATSDSLYDGTVLFDPNGGATVVIDSHTSPTETFDDFSSGNTIIIEGGTLLSAGAPIDGSVVLYYDDGTTDIINIPDAFQGPDRDHVLDRRGDHQERPRLHRRRFRRHGVGRRSELHHPSKPAA